MTVGPCWQNRGSGKRSGARTVALRRPRTNKRVKSYHESTFSFPKSGWFLRNCGFINPKALMNIKSGVMRAFKRPLDDATGSHR